MPKSVSWEKKLGATETTRVEGGETRVTDEDVVYPPPVISPPPLILNLDSSPSPHPPPAT